MPDHQTADFGLVDRGIEANVENTISDGNGVGLDHFGCCATNIANDVIVIFHQRILNADVKDTRPSTAAVFHTMVNLGEIHIDQVFTVLDRNRVAPFAGIFCRALRLMQLIGDTAVDVDYVDIIFGGDTANPAINLSVGHV